MPVSSRPHEPTPRACQVCGERTVSQLRPAIVVRPPVSDLIRQDKGSWDDGGWICNADLQRYRHRHVEDLLRQERGEVTELEAEVLDSLQKHEILSSNPEEEFEEQLTRGQRWADRMATFGGSWAFIGVFGFVLLVWMVLNVVVLVGRAFDPYPFILLNLVLSCLAAVQAPVIMMSQNRQESRDRQRAEHDYQVNLKAELEIRHLHQKMDHLLSKQWERLAEIQQIQMELISEIRARG